MNIRLDGKTALVCGSSKGIGKAIADRFAEMGANLVLIARNEDRLLAINNEYRSKYSGNYYHYALDLGNLPLLESTISDHLKIIGNIDILVNNAGGPESGKLIDAEINDFLKPLQNHLFASQLLTKLLVPGMIENAFGRIINIISVSVKQPIDNLGVSNTLRGAMASWAKTLSRELAINNITVNSILPGYTDTERLDYLFNRLADNANTDYETILKQTTSKIPAGRLAKPEEVANLAGFLASNFAAYINGTAIAVDGAFLNTI